MYWKLVFAFCALIMIFSPVRECKVCNIRSSYICGQDECNCVETKNGKVCQHCDVWCERKERRECVNGKCTPRKCECNACFTGESCAEYKNDHVPQFSRVEYTAAVKPYGRGVLRGIAASDSDDSECAEKGASNCLCSYILYRVFELQDSNAILKINPDTGDLHFDVLQAGVLELTIAAYNFMGNRYPDIRGSKVGYAKVILHVMEQPNLDLQVHLFEMEKVPNIYNWREQNFETSEAHRRSKRATFIGPGNSTAILTPLDEWQYVTNITYTDHVPFSLTISLSGGTNYVNVSIQSDLTSEGFPIYHFCNANIGDIGTNLESWNEDNVTIRFLSSNNDMVDDIIYVDLGNVTNDESDTSDPLAADLQIEFYATVMNPADIIFNANYSVVAMVTVSKELMIVTSHSYQLLELNMTSESLPEMTYVGPDKVFIGSGSSWEITLFIKDKALDLVIDIIQSGNKSLQICHVELISIGTGFGCFNPQQANISMSITDSESRVYRLHYGSMINTDFKAEGKDSDSNITFRVYGSIPATASLGHNYSLNMEVYDGNDITSHSVNVTADDTVIPQSSGTPSLEMSHFSPTIAQSKKHNISVSVLTNVNETEIYSVIISHPQGICNIHFCGVTMETVGHNIICGAPKLDVIYRNTTIAGMYDEVTVMLGPIVNLGLSDDSTANKLTFTTTMCYLECPSLSPGDTFDVSATLTYGSAMLTTSTSLTVSENNMTSNQAPIFNLLHKNGDTHIYYGSQTVYQLEVEFPPMTAYTNLSLEVSIISNNIKPTLSLCTIYQTVLASDFLCMPGIPSAIYNVNNLDTSFNDKGFLNLGTIVNEGSQSIFVNISFVVILLESAFLDGESISTEVSFAYNSHVWNGHITSKFSSISYGYQTFPVFNMSLYSPSNTVKIGEAVLFDLSVTLPLDFISKLTVEVEAVDPEVKICRVYLVSRGHNILCMADKNLYEMKTPYVGEGNSLVSLDLHTISLIDQHTGADANTVTVRTAVALRKGFTYGPSGYSFNIRVADEFSSPAWSETRMVFADTASTFKFPTPNIAVESGGSITKGTSGVVTVNLYTSPGSKTNYTLLINVQSGCASICSAVLISRGEYNPCIADPGDVQLTSKDGNLTYSSAFLYLQEIANIGTNMSTVIDDNNKVTVEMVLNIPSTSSCGTVIVNATLTYEDGALSVTDIENIGVVTSLSTSDNSSYITTVPPAPEVTASIGEYVTWKAKLYVAETSDNFTVILVFPVSAGEAHLTAVNASLSYFGADVACIYNDTMWTSMISEIESTQMTRMNINFAQYITNTGIHRRNQLRRPNIDDNVVEITFTFQVTDHPANLDGSIQFFTVVATGSSGANSSMTDNVTILINGGEQAYLDLNVWTDSVLHSDIVSGDMVSLCGAIVHLNTSNAHASDVILYYRIPVYSVFSSLIYWTDIQPNITVSMDGIIIIQYQLITFTDYPSFCINITIDNNFDFESGITNINTIIPADMTYTSLFRPDRTDTLTHGSDIKTVELEFDSKSCDGNIGVGTFQDCQYSASSQRSSYQAFYAKTGSSSAWSPSIRGPPFCGNEYLQIDFLMNMMVNGIDLYSSGDNNLKYVTNFTLQYSNDGFLWNSVLEPNTSIPKHFLVSFNDTFKTLNDAYSVSLSTSEKFVASMIRILPLDTNSGLMCRPYIRLEASGCQMQSNTTLIGSCPISPIPSSQFSLNDRHYVIDEVFGTIFACISNGVGGDVVCSRSTDSGASWEEIPGLGTVIGIVSNASCVVGISQDGSSRMCSYDDGMSWMACTDEEYTDAVSDTYYRTAKTMPFYDFQSETETTLYTSYGQTSVLGDITGTMSGISFVYAGYSDWSKVAQWGDNNWMAI